MPKIVKNNLGYLGVDFQYKLIAAFITDSKFFKDLYDIIDQNMFTDSYLKTIVGVMKEYYAKHDVTAKYDMISVLLRDKAYTTDDIQYYEETISKLKNVTTEGIDEIEDMAERFFKQQNWVKIANEIKRIAGDGDIAKYDQCEALIQEANAIGRKTIDMASPLDHVKEDLSKENIITIPTGVSKIDEVLGGGLDKGKIGLIMAAMGSGKSLPHSEIIITPNGYTTMGEIKVGDYVIGKDGKPHMVIGKYTQGERDIYKVIFSDGVSCRCDKEHLWNVNEYKQRNHRSRVSRSRTKYYKTPDNSFKTMTLSEIMEKGLYYGSQHAYNFKVPMANPVEFNSIKVDIDPYLLGYFISDGCFSKNAITVGAQDEENVIKLLNECNELFSVLHPINRATNLGFNAEFRKRLSNYYDVDNCKSDSKFIHGDYLYNDKVSRIALLNGLMDSDGTCSKKGSCVFATKSKQLAEDVRTLVLSLGGFASVVAKKRGYFNKKYNEYRDCGTHYEVHFSLVDETIKVFRLSRKQERVRYRNFYATSRFIKAVEFVGKEEASCIKVDADDELFLTRDFIVTHNTSITTSFSASSATFKCPQNDFKGYKVLHIVFEDSRRDINRKYFGRMSQIETKDINRDDATTEDVEARIMNHPDFELIKNNIRVIHLDTGKYSATDIIRVVKKIINEGFKPDMIITDYFECVNPEAGTGGMKKWDQETKTMRVFENGAKELNVAWWIPSQGNRNSVSSELITMDQGSGSIGKQQVAQVVMSVTRSVEDIKDQRATLAILKNRSGSAGIVLNGIVFNNGTCTISCDSTTDFDSPSAFNAFAENKAVNKQFEDFFE